MALVVRTRTSPESIAPSIAAVIRSIDPEQPIYDARTLEAVLDRSLAQRWLQTAILGSFAVIALVLASIGVYGVIAYTVGQRQRDFGIRLALGASRREIVAHVMRRGAALFAAGAIAGLVAAALTCACWQPRFRCRLDPVSAGTANVRPPCRAHRPRHPRAGRRRRSVDRAESRVQ
jgi:predicted lysophospholipase L1 biosynthesis ABC-type transport system permease subunit